MIDGPLSVWWGLLALVLVGAQQHPCPWQHGPLSGVWACPHWLVELCQRQRCPQTQPQHQTPLHVRHLLQLPPHEYGQSSLRCESVQVEAALPKMPGGLATGVLMVQQQRQDAPWWVWSRLR